MITRRIAFTGAQGTGKSTLAERLAAELEYPVLPTPGRIMSTRAIAINRHGTVATQVYAWLIQAELEAAQERFIATRTLIDVWAYGKLNLARDEDTFAGELFAQLTRTTGQLLQGRYDLVIYLPPGLPLRADDVRSGDVDYQAEVDEAISGALRDWEVAYVELDPRASDAYERLLSLVHRHAQT